MRQAHRRPYQQGRHCRAAYGIGSVPLQPGNPVHPQKALPTFAPRRAVFWTIARPQAGQDGGATAACKSPAAWIAAARVRSKDGQLGSPAAAENPAPTKATQLPARMSSSSRESMVFEHFGRLVMRQPIPEDNACRSRYSATVEPVSKVATGHVG